MRIPFSPPPGLYSDDTDFSQAGAWADGSNVRFRPSPEVIGGWADTLNGETLTGICRNVYGFVNSNNTLNIVFGTHLKLQVWYQGILSDITPAGLIDGSADSSGEGAGWGTGAWGEGSWGDPASTYYARTWSLDSYGNSLIASPRGGTIYEWDGVPANAATAVTNAPAVVTCCLVTPERQLIAFGCNEEVSGNFNPLCIRGSDIEDITDWTTASGNNAFEHILEGGGRIVMAKRIGPYVAVWTTIGLHLGQFIGAPGQAYRFDLVAEGCGLASPNAVAVINQSAIWVGRDYQVRVWTVGGIPEVLPCPIWNDFRSNLVESQKDKLAAGSIRQYGEVWIHYPDSRDGIENSRYIAFSIDVSRSAERSVWFRGILARSAHVDAGATDYPILVDPAGKAYSHEFGETADGEDLTNHLKSAAQYVDEGGRRMLVRAIEPDFKSQAEDVSLTIGIRGYPAGAETEKPAVMLAAGTTRKPLRAAGRLMTLQLSSTGRWRMGKPIFDAAPMGGRG